MRKWIALVLLLLVGAEVFAQGSAPSPPQLWRRKGTADTSFVVIKTGDTVMVYDTAQYTKIQLRGSNTAWLLPDTIKTATLVATNKIYSTSLLEIRGSGFIINTFAEGPDTIWSLLGNGHEIVNGYLTVTLGASIEGSEITNQTIGKVDIDTTAAMVYASMYFGTSASSDSAAKSKYYIDHTLAGYPIVGTPAASQGLFYDAGLASFTYAAGGSGGGDNTRIDQTLDTSSYTVGSTTYPGGFWDVSTFTMRGDTGLNIVKSGAHPGDTAIFRPDWTRIQRNDSTLSIRVFKNAAGENMMTMEDSSSFTKISTGNNSGFKFNGDVNIHGNQRFFGSNREIDSLYAIKGAPNSSYMDIFDADGVAIQGLGSNLPVTIGSSTNWTIRADTIRASNGQILGIKYASIDTLYAHRELMRAGQFGILTSTDTALLYTRDSANDTTTVRAVGKLKFTADAGLTEMDSVALHGRLRMYDGTNKSRIDSASGISADTLKTLPGGFLTLQGATSGRVRMKSAATTTSYDLTWPNAQGAAGTVPQNDGSGGLTWSASAGGGNGSADFDSTAGGGLDSNILKGSSGTILLDIHKSATPNVVIGKGATMTSLIIGGNNSGVTAVDTAALIYNNLYFGNQLNKQSKIDSTFVYEQLKKLRYYFKATDLYWAPEKANAADKRFLTWNLCDTAATWPNNSHLAYLYDLVDSTGDSKRPLNHTMFAGERDSLFSMVWNYRTDSAAFTGSTDTSKIGYPEYAILWKNGTQIDSVFIGKGKASLATDSINFTDVPIAAGDVITVQLWFNSKGGTSAKRLRVAWAYLNMRRY